MSNISENKFGKRIKLLRSEKKLTGEEMGKLFNVTKVAISNWEGGRRFPDQTTLNKIADYFDVTLDYLLGRTDLKNEDKQLMEKYDLDEEDLNFLELFRESDEETKNYVYGMMKKILKKK